MVIILSTTAIITWRVIFKQTNHRFLSLKDYTPKVGVTRCLLSSCSKVMFQFPKAKGHKVPNRIIQESRELQKYFVIRRTVLDVFLTCTSFFRNP